MSDVVGFIDGHNDLGIYIDSTLIEYEEIRNIGFYYDKKWFDVQWMLLPNTN